MILLCQNSKIGNNKSSLSLAQGYACLTFLNLMPNCIIPKAMARLGKFKIFMHIQNINLCLCSYKVFKVGITPHWNTL